MTELKPLIFADLDDTFFQTRRKMNGADAYRQVAVAANGDPRKSSFMTAPQSDLFNWLHTTAELIPVTARSGDAFDRVDLPFNTWAILSNGAIIREPGGTIHQPWAEKMHGLLAPLSDTMQAILDAGRSAASAANIDVRSWVVTEDDLATYVVFKLNVVTDASLAALKDLPLPVTGWTRHFNAETLALIPPGSGKAAATDYLAKMLNPTGNRPTLGFGDSQSDLQFMRQSDILMIPTRSQIATGL